MPYSVLSWLRPVYQPVLVGYLSCFLVLRSHFSNTSQRLHTSSSAHLKLDLAPLARAVFFFPRINCVCVALPVCKTRWLLMETLMNATGCQLFSSVATGPSRSSSRPFHHVLLAAPVSKPSLGWTSQE